MANEYDINYDDERFGQVEAEKKQALTEVEQTYGGMINDTDSYYQAQIDATKEWADKQAQLQQENTDFTIEQIEQQKAQAGKDYTKEQAGAYTDWQKQSNAYGVNAEQMASSGLANTGFSESSQVAMYNQYQNRVATARESYNQAVLNYNNNIKEAQLQNNSKLAEIYFTALQQELELSLQGFQYKNQLIEAQANKKLEVDQMYYNRYQDVLNQMNTENALAEEVRQYNESMALQREQLAEEMRQYEQDYALRMKQYEESIRQFDAEMERLKAQDKAENEYKIAQLEFQKQQAQREQEQWEAEMSAYKSSFNGGDTTDINDQNTPTTADNSPAYGSTKKVYTENGKTYVNTEYYYGTLNPDAKLFGTFDNGYQPKAISGYGPVTKTGEPIEMITVTRTGERKYVMQNVWKTPDGSLWYWEGRENKYKKIPSGSGKSGLTSGTGGGGSGSMKPVNTI